MVSLLGERLFDNVWRFRRYIIFLRQSSSLSLSLPLLVLQDRQREREREREQAEQFHWGCSFDLQSGFIERRDAIGESQSYSISSGLREICNYTDYEDAPCQGIFNHEFTKEVVIFWFRLSEGAYFFHLLLFNLSYERDSSFFRYIRRHITFEGTSVAFTDDLWRTFDEFPRTFVGENA